MKTMTRSHTHFGPFVTSRLNKSIKATTSKMSCKIRTGSKMKKGIRVVYDVHRENLL